MSEIERINILGEVIKCNSWVVWLPEKRKGRFQLQKCYRSEVLYIIVLDFFG